MTLPMIAAISVSDVLTAAIPPADLAYLQANAAEVAKARRDHPGEWQTWWRICFAGQLPFIPLVLLLTGHWSPRKARGDDLDHERMVERELERLHRGPDGPGEAASLDGLSIAAPGFADRWTHRSARPPPLYGYAAPTTWSRSR